MKAYRGSKDTAPLILNLGNKLWSVVNITLRSLYPEQRSSVPTEWAAEWAPEPIWTFRRTGTSLTSAGIRTTDRPGRNIAAMLTTHGLLVSEGKKNKMYVKNRGMILYRFQSHGVSVITNKYSKRQLMLRIFVYMKLLRGTSALVRITTRSLFIESYL